MAEEHGEVWWGVIGSGERKKLSDENLASLRAQLEQGVETHVFLAGPATEQALRRGWSISQIERPSDERLIPSYYPPGEQHSLGSSSRTSSHSTDVKLLQELGTGR